MRSILVLASLMVACALPARAEPTLFARYDWHDGATDVSGSPIRHDGILQPGASISGGKLHFDGWDGVALGHVPDLAGATQVHFRFEDVTFDKHGDGGPTCHSPVLIGDAMSWRAGVFFDLPPYGDRTQIQFSIFDWPNSLGISVTVADAVVDHFDSIEYRFDGSAPVAQRLAVRWNDGPWMTGAEGSDAVKTIPTAESVQINNGCSADEDPLWGSVGQVSLYSDQVPEPAAGWVLMGPALLFIRRNRRGISLGDRS